VGTGRLFRPGSFRPSDRVVDRVCLHGGTVGPDRVT
jgi:hypothetical protein